MHIGSYLNKLISALSFSSEVWMSLLLGAVVTVIIAYIIFRIQKKEAAIHLQKHDSRFEELKQLHQQDSEKIKVLYDLILQSQKGSIGEIEAAVLEQKIEIAAEQITEQDSDHAQVLKAIAERDKDEADDLLDKIAQQEHNLVEMYDLRALNENRNGNYSEEIKWYQKILELEPDNFEVFMHYLYALSGADKGHESRELALKTLETVEKEDSPDKNKIYNLSHAIINSYDTDNFLPAEPYIYKALELAKQLYPENSWEVGEAYNTLAVLFVKKHQLKESEEYFLKALSIKEKSGDGKGYDCANVLYNLAYLYNKVGRYQDALPLEEKAVKLRTEALGEMHPLMIQPLVGLSDTYLWLGRFHEAEQGYLKAQNIAKMKLGIEHSEYFASTYKLSILYIKLKKYNEAETILEALLKLEAGNGNSERVNSAMLIERLGCIKLDQNKLDEAEQLVRKALEIYQKLTPDDEDMMLNTIHVLTKINCEKGNYEEALQGSLKVREILIKQGRADSLDMATVESGLATIYAKMERWTDAEQIWCKVISLCEKKESYTLSLVKYMQLYAETLEKLDKQSEADAWKTRAEELQAKLEEEQKPSLNK
jgi:tetratricopeptide (TPR) repeat protein